VENNLNNGKDAFDGFGASSNQHLRALGGKQYQSAKGRVKKKVRIKKDGTW